MKLKVRKSHPDAQLPIKLRNEDAGYDISTIETNVLKPSETKLFRTGIHVQLEKDKDDYHTYGLFLYERSGLGKKGVGRRAGLIDESYTGEIMVLLTNHGDKEYQVLKGDRIAQLVIQRVESIPVYEVQELDETSRNALGFGSSGK